MGVSTLRFPGVTPMALRSALDVTQTTAIVSNRPRTNAGAGCEQSESMGPSRSWSGAEGRDRDLWRPNARRLDQGRRRDFRTNGDRQSRSSVLYSALDNVGLLREHNRCQHLASYVDRRGLSRRGKT